MNKEIIEKPKTKAEKLSDIYDCNYFENGIETQKSNYTDYSWERLGSYFQATAMHIFSKFQPKKTLDVGCAKGFIVKGLSELGVDSYGIDPSKYALSQAHPDIKEKLIHGIAQSIPFCDKSFDVVTCFDVLEHIPERDVSKVLSEMLRVTNKWLILRVVTEELEDDMDTSHDTIHDKVWWNKKIEKTGSIVESLECFANKSVWWFNVPEFLIVVRKLEEQL